MASDEGRRPQRVAAGVSPPLCHASLVRPIPEFDELVTLLQDNKEFPADMHCERGSVQVRFRLDMQGQIVSREVLTSSGLAGFDQEGLALLDRIGRFPPPPPTIGPESLEFTVPIQFDGKGDGCAPN